MKNLEDFGFTYTDAAILDAAEFGAPCHRRRLFVYGTKFPHKWPAKTHKGKLVSARQSLVPLLENREPDGEPLPEWVKPKIKDARGDIIIDCKQGNKVGRQYVSLDEPCFTLVASQGIRHRIRYNGQHYRMRAVEAAALKAGCPWLVTFNVRHFQPGHPDLVTLTPEEFILRLRTLLAELSLPIGERE